MSIWNDQFRDLERLIIFHNKFSQHVLDTNQKCSSTPLLCNIGGYFTPLLKSLTDWLGEKLGWPPFLCWLHSCCTRRAAPLGATERGQGRDLWDTLKVCVHVCRSAYKSHAVFPQSLGISACVCVSVDLPNSWLYIMLLCRKPDALVQDTHAGNPSGRMEITFEEIGCPSSLFSLSLYLSLFLSLKLSWATLIYCQFSFGSLDLLHIWAYVV